MAKDMSRRSFLKVTFRAFLTLFGLSSGGYVYANRIEPSLLDINHLQIKNALIPKSFDGIKIVQFSDTHLGFQYNLRQFKKLINKINALKPDVIIFSGDLMDEPNKFMEINHLVPLLQQLKAPLGKYCIYGNHDHGGYGSNIYRNIMETSDFKVLLNQSKSIKLKDGSRIYLVGIDDAMLGRPDMDLALKHVPIDSFKIVLSHAPDLADAISQYPVHWQLSGHSHGGQVKLPFFGALIKPPFARKYTEGLYRIGDQQTPLTLYVNRGIGTTRLPFRFMAKPEVSLFTLHSLEKDFAGI